MSQWRVLKVARNIDLYEEADNLMEKCNKMFRPSMFFVLYLDTFKILKTLKYLSYLDERAKIFIPVFCLPNNSNETVKYVSNMHLKGFMH